MISSVLSALEIDLKMLQGVFEPNFELVKAALMAGGDINGPPAQPHPPIVSAVFCKNVGMIKFLLQQGADPDRPVTLELLFPEYGVAKTNLGECALHIAARTGMVEIVRLLLRSRADPNAIDIRGYTPLVASCESRFAPVEVVRLLLEAGADPTLAQQNGFTPLHVVALKGRTNLVDLLYSTAPTTLNRRTATLLTPLFFACFYGHESMVSKLLSLEAMQRVPLDDVGACPLVAAIHKGFMGVVRVLVNEGGIRAVGGSTALTKALFEALCCRRAGILRLLLTAVDRKERSLSEWVNMKVADSRLLHCGTSFCCPAAVSVLLKAGADEAGRDSRGYLPQCAIGLGIGLDDEIRTDQGKAVAIRRMLQHGPAYRARSWAWPSDGEVDAGGSGDGDTASAPAAAVLLSLPAVKTPPVVGVRIFRPKKKHSNNNKLLVRLIGRYCAKD